MSPTDTVREQLAAADMNSTVDPAVTSSCSVDNSSSGSGSEKARRDVTSLVWAVGGPTLLVVGLVGNVLIIVTMTRRRMRGTSTCVYLCAMAVLDLMVLAAGFVPNWLDGAGYVEIKVNCSQMDLSK